MSDIIHLNTARSRFEPDAVYAQAIDVVNEPGLNRGQKIATLERWSLTLQDRMRATNEGMEPTDGQTADEAATIVEIAQALAVLRDQPEDPTA